MHVGPHPHVLALALRSRLKPRPGSLEHRISSAQFLPAGGPEGPLNARGAPPAAWLAPVKATTLFGGRPATAPRAALAPSINGLGPHPQANALRRLLSIGASLLVRPRPPLDKLRCGRRRLRVELKALRPAGLTARSMRAHRATTPASPRLRIARRGESSTLPLRDGDWPAGARVGSPCRG